MIFNILIWLPLSNLSFSQNINGKLGTGGQFIIRDTNNTFLSVPQSTGYLTLNRSLTLPVTTNATSGIIFKGANSFLHNYGNNNTFLGINSGNFTMTGGFNTVVGWNTFFSNTTGNQNTAFGTNSLSDNTMPNFSFSLAIRFSFKISFQTCSVN